MHAGHANGPQMVFAFDKLWRACWRVTSIFSRIHLTNLGRMNQSCDDDEREEKLNS
jgi:hypothetical protein